MIARKVVLALVLLKSVLQLNLASYLSCFDHAMEPRGGAVFENGEEERLRWQLERWFSNVLAEDFPFSTKGWKLLSFFCLFIQWLLDVEVIICKSFCRQLSVSKHHTIDPWKCQNTTPWHLTPHQTLNTWHHITPWHQTLDSAKTWNGKATGGNQRNDWLLSNWGISQN